MSSTAIRPSFILGSKSAVTLSASRSITLLLYCFSVASKAFIMASLIFLISNSATELSLLTTRYIMILLPINFDVSI